MKKVLTIVMAMALVLSMSVCAFAANVSTDGGRAEVEVSYGVDQVFEVSIPENVQFAQGALTKTGTVEATKVLIPNGKKLTVDVTSGNDYHLVYEGSKIAYTVTGEALLTAQAATALTVESGSTSGEQELTFATDEGKIAAATKAGTHKDTLTFTCAIGDIA